MADGYLNFDTKINENGFNEGISNLSKIATTGLGVAVGNAITKVVDKVGSIGTAAVKVGMNFEAEMSKVASISGATGDEFQKLIDKAKEMGSKTKFSATESAQAMEYMAMAGWKTQDMVGGLKGIMDLAAASGEDLATTSDIVTDALTAFGLKASDSTHFADVLAKASSNANTMKRIDLIVNRYTRNAETEVEKCSWKVIQGTPVASNPAVPAYTSGNLQDGDLVDDCPAFEVHYDGINVTEVKSLLSVADGLSGLSRKLTNTNTNLAKANTVLENRKPIFIDSTSTGSVTFDTTNFLKSGITYAFVVAVNSNLNSGTYAQEITCKLNDVIIGKNGNYYTLTSIFSGKCSKGDRIHITSYKNGGNWSGWSTRCIFIPLS